MVVEAEIATSGHKVSDAVILKVVETIGDPFLITALVVVVLMYFLLRHMQKIFDNSLKDVFNEMRAMSQVLTDAVSTNKILTDIIVRLKNENNKKD